jgi:deoxyribodipyrimidine photo-lyase
VAPVNIIFMTIPTSPDFPAFDSLRKILTFLARQKNRCYNSPQEKDGSMIQPERIRHLNGHGTRKGRYILYWMQAAQRAAWNHALEYAVRFANEIDRPVVALFGLTARFPEANARHYAFMLQGLQETERALRQKGIFLAVLPESPEKAVLSHAANASLIVTDRGYLRVQRAWREAVAGSVRCPLVQVESDVIVPVETASDREAYSARTLRPRIRKVLERFLVPLEETSPKRDSLSGASSEFESVDLSNPQKLVETIGAAKGAGPVAAFRGGAGEAGRLLEEFIETGLPRYARESRDPALSCTSGLSPYLHFGQIAPLSVALRIRREAGRHPADCEAFLEQLIIRRELSMNFTYYNARYSTYAALPEWARRTLEAHRSDRREPVYEMEELEGARTHDPCWNAAMKEMLITGTMHNTMRMYWGKKILEWSPDPEEAFRRTLHLNNRYLLDGRDPNSFAGVAWCFGKHDRPWPERAVTGSVRSMTASGLERKYDMAAYVRRIEQIEAAAAARASGTRKTRKNPE